MKSGWADLQIKGQQKIIIMKFFPRKVAFGLKPEEKAPLIKIDTYLMQW